MSMTKDFDSITGNHELLLGRRKDNAEEIWAMEDLYVEVLMYGMPVAISTHPRMYVTVDLHVLVGKRPPVRSVAFGQRLGHLEDP